MATSTTREFGIEDDDDTDDNIDEMFLTFMVQDNEYAVCLAHVIEIVVGQKVIPVPDVPHFITGLINLRGRVIPVMDMRRRFGLQSRAFHERLGIVVVEVDGASTGLAVDAVNDVLQIPAAEVEPAIQRGASGAGLIRGIGKRADAITFILDARRLLDSGAPVLEPAEPAPHATSGNALRAPAAPTPRTLDKRTDQEGKDHELG